LSNAFPAEEARRLARRLEIPDVHSKAEPAMMTTTRPAAVAAFVPAGWFRTGTSGGIVSEVAGAVERCWSALRAGGAIRAADIDIVGRAIRFQRT